MTKVTLERRAGISVKSLGEFEKGRAIPSADALAAIASVLQFPVAFFYRPDLEEPTVHGVSFRSLKSMGASKRNAALAGGALGFELNQWIESEFELQPSDLPDLRDHDPVDAALALRNYWGIGIQTVPNMVHLLESKGVRVFSLSEKTREIDAYSLWYHELPFVFLNTMKTVEHSRMDAAHELGHLVLHRHGGPRGRDVEKDAKCFGSAFLMPRESIVGVIPRLVGPSIEQLATLKRHWGVSLAALAYRLHELGLVNEWSYRGICIELSKAGRAKEPNPIRERETSLVFAKVFAMLRESGMTKADVAKKLDLYTEDLDALIFGLGQMAVESSGGRLPDAEADARRRQFRVFS